MIPWLWPEQVGREQSRFWRESAGLGEDEEFGAGRVEWQVPVGICGLEVRGQSEARGAHGGAVSRGGCRMTGCAPLPGLTASDAEGGPRLSVHCVLLVTHVWYGPWQV